MGEQVCPFRRFWGIAVAEHLAAVRPPPLQFRPRCHSFTQQPLPQCTPNHDVDGQTIPPCLLNAPRDTRHQVGICTGHALSYLPMTALGLHPRTLSECLFFFGIYSFHYGGSGGHLVFQFLEAATPSTQPNKRKTLPSMVVILPPCLCSTPAG